MIRGEFGIYIECHFEDNFIQKKHIETKWGH